METLNSLLDVGRLSVEQFEQGALNAADGLVQAAEIAEAAEEKFITFEDAASAAGERAAQSFSNGLSNAITDVILGTKSAEDAMKEFGARTVAVIIDIIAQMVALKAVSASLKRRRRRNRGRHRRVSSRGLAGPSLRSPRAGS